MKEIAERIKKIRLERGMTQQDLANALGLKSRSSINKIEMDAYEIGLDDEIKKMAGKQSRSSALIMCPFWERTDRGKENENPASRPSERR